MPAKKSIVLKKAADTSDSALVDKICKRLGKSSKNFTVRDLQEHIMESPDMFVGSTKKRPIDEWVFDFETQRMKRVSLDTPDAVKRVFLEILTNAGDASFESVYSGVDPGPVCFDFSDDGYLSITNGGLPMPLEPHSTTTKDKLVLVPDSAFGVLMSSTNYNSKTARLTCGRNGFGSKLTNIFSTHFIAEVGDSGRLDDDGNAISGQHYIGEWKDHMFVKVRSDCKPGYINDVEIDDVDDEGKPTPGPDYWRRRSTGAYKGDPFVKIKWLLDFKRFDMINSETGIGGYSDDEIGLFARYVIEVSLSCQIPVKINGKTYDYRNIRTFAGLFWSPEIVDRAVSQFCWPKGEEVPEEFESAKPAKKEILALDPMYSRYIESRTLLLDTPDSQMVLSYANGMSTLEGGVHVDAVYKKICPTIIEYGAEGGFKRTKKDKVQSKAARRAAKSGIKKGAMRVRGKGGKKNGTAGADGDGKPEAPKITLKPGDIKKHVSMVTVCRVSDPIWDGQCKKKIEDPSPNIKIDEEVFAKMLDNKQWQLSNRLKNEVGAQTLKAIRQTSGTGKDIIDLGSKGEEANFANRKGMSECSLFIIEGKSASSYPFKRIKDLPGGKNLWGYFCLKGKPMNVSANSLLDIAGYEEFNILKEVLNLEEEKIYSTPESRKSLKYKQVILTTDADTDGMHIQGLCINWFHRRWPALLECGFVQILVTPVIRTFPSDKKLSSLRFYDEADFAAWHSSSEGKVFKGRIKYYKGLGSSKDEDIKADIKTAPTVTCVYDPEASNSLELAFNPKKTDERKLWIGRWRTVRLTAPVFRPVSLHIDRPISEIINFCLTPYTIENLFRSIPSYKDGLKKAQRQAIYHTLKHWHYTAAGEKKEIKVARLGTAACEKTQYHHGEKSMHETIIHLTQDFIGTNNLSIYEQDGQFGTRSKGGEDRADPRYCAVLPAWWMQYVFQKEMIDLVPLRQVDGEDAEPNWIPSDIPLGIINGCRGLATGWSTNIPPHHPLDVIDWILDKIENTRMPDPLMPFYNGFRGVTEIFTAASGKENEVPKVDSEVDSEFEDPERDESEIDIDDETEKAIEQMLQSSQRTKGRSIITTGNFEIIAENEKEGTVDLVVTEIPVGRYNLSYITWAKRQVKAGKIRSATDVGKDPYIQMTLTGVPKEMANHAKLGLVKSSGLSNLVLIDDDGIPRPYKSIEHIVSRYVRNMLDMYSQLKRSRLSKLKEVIQFSTDERAIIEKIKSKELEFIDLDEDTVVYPRIYELGLNREVFDKLGVKQLMKGDVRKLTEKIAKLTREYESLDRIPSVNLWIERLTEFRKVLAKKYPAPLIPSESQVVTLDGERIYNSAIMNCEA